MTIYICGRWFDTGPRANDTYFLCEMATTDKSAALGSTWETVFAAEEGDDMVDWIDITHEREPCPES